MKHQEQRRAKGRRCVLVDRLLFEEERRLLTERLQVVWAKRNGEPPRRKTRIRATNL